MSDTKYLNNDAGSTHIEIHDDVSTLIGRRRCGLALLAMYREGHPSLRRVFPTLEYQIDQEISTQLTDKEVEELIGYVNNHCFSELVTSLVLIFFGGGGIVLGILGITFFLQRTPGVVTQNVAMAPVLCLGLPMGVPIFWMGLKSILALRRPDRGMLL